MYSILVLHFLLVFLKKHLYFFFLFPLPLYQHVHKVDLQEERQNELVYSDKDY